MNTFQLQCFLTVSETLNFARAAEALSITQPSITHQIQSLESELGVKLFHRTTRKVTMTPQGEALIQDAKNMLMIENHVKKRYATGYTKNVEVLSLGLPGTQYLTPLHTVLRKLKLQHPNFMPEYHIEPKPKLYPLLEENSIDAVFDFYEPNQKNMPFKFKALCRVPIAAVTAIETGTEVPDYFCRSKSDLIEKPIIMINPAHTTGEIIRLQDQLLEHLPPNQIYFSDSVEIALAMVKSGFGFTLLPKIHVPNDSELLSCVLEDVEPLSYGIFYKSLKENPLISDLIDCFSV